MLGSFRSQPGFNRKIRCSYKELYFTKSKFSLYGTCDRPSSGAWVPCAEEVAINITDWKKVVCGSISFLLQFPGNLLLFFYQSLFILNSKGIIIIIIIFLGSGYEFTIGQGGTNVVRLGPIKVGPQQVIFITRWAKLWEGQALCGQPSSHPIYNRLSL